MPYTVLDKHLTIYHYLGDMLYSHLAVVQDKYGSWKPKTFW
jgi:hypothetical protein